MPKMHQNMICGRTRWGSLLLFFITPYTAAHKHGQLTAKIHQKYILNTKTYVLPKTPWSQ